MAKVFFDNPMTPAGDEKAQLQQIYRFLFAMSEKLNDAMNAISTEQMAPEVQIAIENAGSTPEAQQKTYNTLKSMIVKSAEIVRSEMQEISTQLQSEYSAISEDFGELTQSLEATIRATASGVVQEYGFTEQINGVSGDLTSFKRKTNQYIFSGLLDDSTTPPTYGIAIGNNVTGTDAQGNEVLNNQNKVATFTSSELAFYMSGTKVAYFANNVFYINQGKINQSLQIGSNFAWKSTGADGSGALVLVKL